MSIQGFVTYLGLPIAAKSSQRKKHVYKRIEEMTQAINRITDSSLRFNQAVDAIKRFVLPMIDYELMANTEPVNGLKRLDRLICDNLTKIFLSFRHSGGMVLHF